MEDLKPHDLMVVNVDDPPKSTSYDDGEECEEQVKDHLVANENNK